MVGKFLDNKISRNQNLKTKYFNFLLHKCC